MAVTLLEQALRAIDREGVPNYFGEQRFGMEQANVGKALGMFEGRRVDRAKRSIYLSAARSFLFNQVLAWRVEQGTWNKPLPGEVWMLEGTKSIFGPEELTDDISARCAAKDIHPTGPMWGAGTLRSQGGRANAGVTLAGRIAGALPGVGKSRIASGTTCVAIDTEKPAMAFRNR